MFEGRKIHDVTRKIKNGMTVWPGDPGVAIRRSLSIAEGGVANVSQLAIGAHSGTHMDAPLHFFDGVKDMSSLDISRFSGSVIVVSADGEEIGEEVLRGYDLKRYKAVFFKTRSSMLEETDPFQENFPAITEECARHLVEKGIETVGTDYMSIERSRDNRFPVHKLLLSHEVAIIENLCLKGIEPGEYDFICLPLKIEGSDGSPVRALLIE